MDTTETTVDLDTFEQRMADENWVLHRDSCDVMHSSCPSETACSKDCGALDAVQALLNEARRFRAELAEEKRRAEYHQRQHSDAWRELTRARERIEMIAGSRDRLARQVSAVKLTRQWTNEDGRGFVFVDDLHAALQTP